MANRRITLEIPGLPEDDGYVRLKDFLGALQSLQSALTQADNLVTEGGKSAYGRIVGLSCSSPATITVEAVPFDPSDKRTDRIVPTILNAPKRSSGMPIDDPSRLLLNAIDDLVGLSENRPTPVILKNGDGATSLLLETSVRREISRVLTPAHRERGSVRGRLEAINLHAGANNFRIYPIVGPHKVICRFPQSLIDQAVAAVNQRVVVIGILHYREGEHFPHQIDVADVKFLQPDSELPTLSELRGIAPDATGELKSEEFIRKLRDAWQE
jgi:hypothetical protein